MSKISIILPIYNVEKYLKRCIDSIINQTLDDVEIILATDGPENCDKICEEYANLDKRVKVVFHPGSYGKAFNKSLEVATGNYIGIVETDDWCDETMFEKLYNKAVKNNADVVKCGFYFAHDNENKNFTVLYDGYNSDIDISQYPDFLSTQPSVWSCIYKKDFLIKNNIKMIEKRMAFIDSPFHYETLIKAEKYVLLKEPLYYYYQDNENQTVRNVKPLDGLNSEIYAYKNIRDDKDLWSRIKEGYIFSAALHLQWNFERLTEKDKNLFWKVAHKFVKELNLDGVSYIYFNNNLLNFFLDIKEYKDYSTMKFSYTMIKILNKIFYVKNDYIHKTINILGIKIKFKSKKLLKIHNIDKNSFWEDILSVKNQKIRKVITILGIKFKFKSKKLLEAQRWNDLQTKLLNTNYQIQIQGNQIISSQNQLNFINEQIKSYIDYTQNHFAFLKDELGKHTDNMKNYFNSIDKQLTLSIDNENKQLNYLDEKFDNINSQLTLSINNENKQLNYLDEKLNNINNQFELVNNLHNKNKELETSLHNLTTINGLPDVRTLLPEQQEEFILKHFGIKVRRETSDIPVVFDIFQKYTYECVNTENVINTIIDAGANIGCASVYFARKYPSATIYALEPEASNFELLLENIKMYPNVIPLNIGLWGSDCNLSVINNNNGNWGFETKLDDDNSKNNLSCFSLRTLVEKYNIQNIDVLKIDVEGAEKDIFEHPENIPFDKISIISVELHDRMMPNCSTTFFKAMAQHPEFNLDYTYTENLVFRKVKI